MAKVILISQMPLPFHKIGSWTTLYKNYLSNDNLIDYIVCEKPLQELLPMSYSFVEPTLFSKVRKRIVKNPYLDYLKALIKIIDPNEKYIIQIVDNFGIIRPLQRELESRGLRKNCYIQFFYHGYSPFCKNNEQNWFFEYTDEIILLTYDSYLEHKKYYTSLPNKFSVLHNGIDSSKFYPLTPELKSQRRLEKGIQDKKIFIWCSQDRPKKGLQIILDAWKFIEEKYNNVELWVIGTKKRANTETVKFIGSVPNDELPVYFQITDCYLFPTLCQEGFGMSLIEAMHSGNYCIASENGGVGEVLGYGKYGKLIKYPNMVQEWVKAILEFLEHPVKIEDIPYNKYSTLEWNSNMNGIIENAKKSMNS